MIDKTYIEQLVSARNEMLLKLEVLLDEDNSLKLYHKKLDSFNIDVISKNESILVIANENFEEYFRRVDYERAYKAKGEKYKSRFKKSYEQCKAAVRSNGNLSLNLATLGVVGPLFDPERFSNGYSIYNDFKFAINELYNLDNKYFNKLENYSKDYISINALAKLIYGVDKKDIIQKRDEIELEDEIDETEVQDEGDLIYLRNKILFGPPGTGKSYNIKSKMNLINVKEENTVRITFHPEYSYYEFVGQYKPVVGYERIVGEIIHPGTQKTTNKKPFVFYGFVPGPFTKAIVNALKLKKEDNSKAPENTLLIVEEINRGNSSAIFGDIFQLLDRINDVNSDYYGESEYSVSISTEMKEYIKDELYWDEEDWKDNFPRGFVIPSNLYIYATMNTSDQSLYPIDSAFKRRWDMEYMYIDYNEKKLEDLYLPEPYNDTKWLDFIKKINGKIVDYTEVDDKQLGQWFVGNSLSHSEFLGKVISYLWFDIFRYDPEVLFKEKIKTFDDIRVYYSEGVFREDIIETSVDKDEED